MTAADTRNAASTSHAAPLVAPPGLKGLVVADTVIGSVRGADGFYHYRQHDATALARTVSLEAVWHLLWRGSLPSPEAEAAFRSEIVAARGLIAEQRRLVVELARTIRRPHLVLQAALPLIRPDARPTLDLTPLERAEDVLRLVAAAPTVLGIVHGGTGHGGTVRGGTGHGGTVHGGTGHGGTGHGGTGHGGTETDGGSRPGSERAGGVEVGHAAHWLGSVGGDPTDELAVTAVERYLIATIDHGLNASTFTTRVVTSTGADAPSALSAGVGALAGPLHGGAPARALAMIDEIGDPARAAAWVRARLAAGEKIMGFGHAVYRAEDPRSALMRDTAERFASVGRGAALVERAVAIEEAVLAELRQAKPGAAIVTNVEYYAGIVLHLAGVPAEAFTSSFTVSRMIGWGAHLLEQAANNKIMRPSARYVGPEPTQAGCSLGSSA